MDVAAGLAAGKLPQEILEEVWPDLVVSLDGAAVSELPFWMDGGHPILVMTSGGTAELIVGYDRNYLTLYDALSGRTYKMSRNDAQEVYGNRTTQLLTRIN